MVNRPEKATFKYFQVLRESNKNLANWSDIEEGVDWCIHDFLHDISMESLAHIVVHLRKKEYFDDDESGSNR